MRVPALLLGLLALVSSLDAQVAALRVEAGGEGRSVDVALHRGYPAHPASALRLLGAEYAADTRGARAVLFGDTLVFESYSPFFFASGRAQQLVGAVYREGGVLYLPHQLFAEWLPARYPDRLEYRDGTLRVREPATATRAQAPAADTQVSAAADTQASAARTQAPVARAASDVRVVIIDPGHGGRDPGKVGPNGLREKDVTLAVALRLADELRHRGGYEVHLTRSTDTLIALADRPRLANEWKAGRPAALFLSLHANSAPSSSARGFETFFLSEARTEDERRVAEMENAAVKYEDSPDPMGGEGLDLILNHLRNDFYQRASNDFAEVVQRRIASFHPGPDRGVKQAGFRVLVGAFMPAILVEMAFISNRGEATLLGQDRFRERMSKALADAVDEFFAQHEHLWTAR